MFQRLKIASSRPSFMAREQDLVHPIAKRCVLGRRDANVVASSDLSRLIHEPRVAADSPLREYVIQQDRVHATQNQVGIRMHIVLVDDWPDAELRLGVDEKVVRERGAERRHSSPAEILKCAIARRIGVADRQDLAKLVVRNGDREARPARRTVFDSAQSDVEVAPSGGRIETRKTDLQEPRRPLKPFGKYSRDLDFEPNDARRIARVGFDKRGATFRIAAPTQLIRRLSVREWDKDTTTASKMTATFCLML